jgi:hypothetical protein
LRKAFGVRASHTTANSRHRCPRPVLRMLRLRRAGPEPSQPRNDACSLQGSINHPKTRVISPLTNEKDVVVHLALVLALRSVQLGHLTQQIEHPSDDLVVTGIHTRTYLEPTSAGELALHASEIAREKLDERSCSTTLLARNLCRLNDRNLLVLDSREFSRVIWRKAALTMWLLNSALSLTCCFSSSPRRNVFPRSSASIRNRSRAEVIPMTWLSVSLERNASECLPRSQAILDKRPVNPTLQLGRNEAED